MDKNHSKIEGIEYTSVNILVWNQPVCVCSPCFKIYGY